MEGGDYMRRRIISIFTVMLLVCSLLLTAQAVSPRLAGGTPRLSFNGNTAECSVTCKGNNASDTVDATLTLYQGSTYVDSWSDSGKYRVSLSGEHKVQSGKSYKLVLDYSINGVKQTSVSTSKVCP